MLERKKQNPKKRSRSRRPFLRIGTKVKTTVGKFACNRFGGNDKRKNPAELKVSDPAAFSFKECLSVSARKFAFITGSMISFAANEKHTQERCLRL